MLSMHGADLEVRMSFKEDLDLADELAEKWGLRLEVGYAGYPEAYREYSLISVVASFKSPRECIEWIQSEFEDK